MKTFILFIGVIFILGSCSPCKRLQRKCPPIIKDSISYVETIKFDTITLLSPADTLWFEIPVKADLNELIIDAGNKPGPSVKIKIKDQILSAEVICPEDSLKSIIASLETELNNQTTITKIEKVDVVKNSRFAFFTIIFFFCSIILAAAYVYIKIKTKAFRGLLK